MIKLYDKATGQEIGTITHEQLQFMINHLEEESPEDTDYYINLPTVDMFEAQGADPALVALLRNALGDRQDMDIQYVEEA